MTRAGAIERAIGACTDLMRILGEYHDYEAAQVAARCQRDLIRLRSDLQVAGMERKQGLGPGCGPDR